MTDYIVQQKGSEAHGYELRQVNSVEQRTLKFLSPDIFTEILPESEAISKYKSLSDKRARAYEDSFYATD